MAVYASTCILYAPPMDFDGHSCVEKDSFSCWKSHQFNGIWIKFDADTMLYSTFN